MPPKRSASSRNEAGKGKREENGKKVNDGNVNIFFSASDLDSFNKQAKEKYPESTYEETGKHVFDDLNKTRLGNSKNWKSTDIFQKFLCLIYFPALKDRIQNKRYQAEKREQDARLAIAAAKKRKEARAAKAEYVRKGVNVSISITNLYAYEFICTSLYMHITTALIRAFRKQKRIVKMAKSKMTELFRYLRTVSYGESCAVFLPRFRTLPPSSPHIHTFH